MKYYTHDVILDGDERLEVELRYRRDRGTSWYTGQQQKRGLVLGFTPVRVERARDYTARTYVLGNDRGRTLFLEEWARQSDKRGREMAAVVAARIDRIAAAAVAQDWQQVFVILSEASA